MRLLNSRDNEEEYYTPKARTKTFLEETENNNVKNCP
jgi:hypothetical protein